MDPMNIKRHLGHPAPRVIYRDSCGRKIYYLYTLRKRVKGRWVDTPVLNLDELLMAG